MIRENESNTRDEPPGLSLEEKAEQEIKNVEEVIMTTASAVFTGGSG